MQTVSNYTKSKKYLFLLALAFATSLYRASHQESSSWESFFAYGIALFFYGMISGIIWQAGVNLEEDEELGISDDNDDSDTE